MKKTMLFLDQNLEKILCLVLFGAMIFLAVLQVIFRFVLNASLDWTEELARYCFIASIYAGAALGVKEEQHIRVEIVNVIFPEKIAFGIRFIANLIWLGFAILIMVQGFQMCSVFFANGQTSPTLRLPMGMVYSVVPIGFFLMTIRLIQRIYMDFKCRKDCEA